MTGILQGARSKGARSLKPKDIRKGAKIGPEKQGMNHVQTTGEGHAPKSQKKKKKNREWKGQFACPLSSAKNREGARQRQQTRGKGRDQGCDRRSIRNTSSKKRSHLATGSTRGRLEKRQSAIGQGPGDLKRESGRKGRGEARHQGKHLTPSAIKGPQDQQRRLKR